MTHISSEGVRFSQNTQELRQMFTAAVAEDFARADKATRVRYQLAVKNLGASLLMVSMRLAVAEQELASFSSFSTSPGMLCSAQCDWYPMRFRGWGTRKIGSHGCGVDSRSRGYGINHVPYIITVPTLESSGGRYHPNGAKVSGSKGQTTCMQWKMLAPALNSRSPFQA